MILYHLHDWQRALIAPWRLAAETTLALYENPCLPLTYTPLGRGMAAAMQLFERTTRRYEKPVFDLMAVHRRGASVAIEEEIVTTKPFCNLIHFRRATENPDVAESLTKDPRVLIVAPMSGHHATLLRGTVEAMLPEHDVFITDWIDARLVPQAQGKFDLEDYITYMMDFMRQLGPDVHVIAVCQPAVPVLCAVALMAEHDDPAQPRSMTLMGGPIDTRVAKTVVTKLAEEKPLAWFRNTAVHTLPYYYPGAHRMVYPGFLQLQGFMQMNLQRHVGEHGRLFRHLVRGDGDSVAKHKAFYDEYLSVMDVTAEFYLQTVERVFQTHDLPLGTFRWHGELVKPEAIKRTALLTVEGELDDISAPGQTRPAHSLCSSLPENMKHAHLEMGVGHYGIFNGRKWRESIQPLIARFIRTHSAQTVVPLAKSRDAG